jgi:hypothetical protein
MVIVWLCPKFSCICAQIYSYGTEIVEFDLGYIELFDECSNL